MNESNLYIPQLRVEKTTRNKDDLRVMIAGTLFCIFMILMQPFAFRAYDFFWADRPFVSATIQIIRVEGSDVPVIKYDADATQNVTGTWIASIHEANGDRITSRRGPGSYNSLEDEPKIWTWAAFFDNEQDVSTPDVPTKPFFICVRYDVKARDSEVDDQSDEFCSDVYNPVDPFYELNDLLERVE